MTRETTMFIRFLREREGIFDEIRNEKNLEKIILGSGLTILFFSAIYGIVMGLFAGDFVILMDMVKVPLIMLTVLYTSSPSYFVVAALLGLEIRFKQMLAILSVSYAVASTVLVSFTPVVFVYSIYGTTHLIIHLVHYILFSLAGVSGIYYLVTGMWSIYGRGGSRNISWILPLIVGGLLTLLVGAELVWLLRPYFHYHQYFFEGLGVTL